jgi:hypothetical protein
MTPAASALVTHCAAEQTAQSAAHLPNSGIKPASAGVGTVPQIFDVFGGCPGFEGPFPQPV